MLLGNIWPITTCFLESCYFFCPTATVGQIPLFLIWIFLPKNSIINSNILGEILDIIPVYPRKVLKIVFFWSKFQYLSSCANKKKVETIVHIIEAISVRHKINCIFFLRSGIHYFGKDSGARTFMFWTLWKL